MTKWDYKVLGVMSGTSLDGIDLVYVGFNEIDWSFEILAYQTVAYDSHWRDVLAQAYTLDKEELIALDVEYTLLLANTINKYIAENDIQELDHICSHGHTILHQPDLGVTYQIGNRHELAKATRHSVVCDFRTEDVALGGQGAPLVPIGDRLLFSDYDFCLNLGGFANVSYDDGHDNRIAYDICPVNIVLNHYCRKIDLDYDDRGNLASKGKLDHDLLKKLNALDYYRLPAPKSLGLEWVENHVFPLIDRHQLNIDDILRTFVEHVAVQLSNAFKKSGKALVTGGGAYNDFLIDRLRVLSLPDIVIPSQELVDFKEALIFGLLGILKIRNEINCLSSVTGATQDHSSGKIFVP